MELYAAGFNAWNQLNFEVASTEDEDPEDLGSFMSVLKDDQIRSVRSFLSYTTLNTSSGLRTAGMLPSLHIALYEAAPYRLFAEASNDVVVVLGKSGILSQFRHMKDFLEGVQGTSFSNVTDIVQLQAYETGFVALSATGQVWTWGDERYSLCLGRDVTEEFPANMPGLVTDLEDLPTGQIVQIAAGGYMAVALTSGNDLYCWGGHPGRPAIIEGQGRSPIPVLIEENDIVDVGVGDTHLIALTTNNEVFVIGGNDNGQLGQDLDKAKSWTKVNLGLSKRVNGVAAGPRTSFIIVEGGQA